MFAAPTRAQQMQDVAPAKGHVAAVSEARHEFRIISTTDAIVEAYPTLSWFVDDPMFGEMHAIETWLSFRYAGHSDRMVVALTEVLLASVPTAGLSLTSSLETASFGGFMSVVSTAIIEWSGNKAAVGSLMPFAAIHGLAATLTIFRRAEARQVAAAPRFGLLSDTRG
jgi:MHS family citrate/tricarballylate:H+ symporter-like MFS transporter